MIKTIKLTGTEQAVTFAGRYQYFHVHNLGGGEVLASLTAEVTRGKDDVLIVPSGSTGYVQMDAAKDTIYLAGTGEIQVAGSGNAFSPFKPALKGGDDIASESGAVAAATVDYPLVALNLYGKSVQDGTPTPDAPIPIVSVGDDGAVVISCNNGSDNSVSATITSGLPLCSAGEVCDELIYNADGTGKIIKRTGIYTISEGDKVLIMENAGDFRRFRHPIECKTGEALCTAYNYKIGFEAANETVNIDEYAGSFTVYNGSIRFVSNETTAEDFIINNLGVTVVYQLAAPQEIELSAAEMAELGQLQTFGGITNIYNDEGAKMTVKVATNPLLSEFVKPVIDGLITRIENLEAATLSMGGNV